MVDRPAQPPEGKLIAAAAKSRRLSQREAAKRAGISEGRWRQIVQGYQTVSGNHVPVRGPDSTVARMAWAVGVSTSELMESGREDAAEVLREIGAGQKSPTAFEAVAAMVEQINGTRDPHLRRILELWPLLGEWQRRSLVGQAWYMAGSPPELRPADVPEETAPQRGTDEESRRTG